MRLNFDAVLSCIKENPAVLTSVAAITNYHKFSGLKQYRFITQFWRSEVWSALTWAKIKGSTGLHSFWRLWGRGGGRIVSLTFPASQSSLLYLGSCPPPSSSKPVVLGSFPRSAIFPAFPVFFPLFRIHSCDFFGPTWITQDNHYVSIFLTSWLMTSWHL